jgi:predicted GNAT family acetyltransferase
MEVIHDKEKNRFYIVLDGGECRVDYTCKGDCMDVFETFVSREERGKGLATKMLKEVMEYAKRNNLKIKPTCPYIKVFLRRHPEYKELVIRKS